MGVDTLRIEQRYYIGKYGPGTVFSSWEDYLIDGLKVSVRVVKRAYEGRSENGRNIFKTKTKMQEFSLNDSDAENLQKAFGRMRNDADSRPTANHYDKKQFDRRRYEYCDAVLNGVSYELNLQNAEISGSILRILRTKEMLADCDKNDTSNSDKKAEKVSILLEKPATAEPKRIEAQNKNIERRNEGQDLESAPQMTTDAGNALQEAEDTSTEDATPKRSTFHRELLGKPNPARWNQVAEKF